jgi:hypothetical protein
MRGQVHKDVKLSILFFSIQSQIFRYWFRLSINTRNIRNVKVILQSTHTEWPVYLRILSAPVLTAYDVIGSGRRVDDMNDPAASPY